MREVCPGWRSERFKKNGHIGGRELFVQHCRGMVNFTSKTPHACRKERTLVGFARSRTAVFSPSAHQQIASRGRRPSVIFHDVDKAFVRCSRASSRPAPAAASAQSPPTAGGTGGPAARSAPPRRSARLPTGDAARARGGRDTPYSTRRAAPPPPPA